MRRAKSAYYRSKVASQNNNPKRAWKTINNLLGRSCNDTVINELRINNDSITSPEEMADAFNEYFVQIGPNLACSLAVSDVTFDQFFSPTQSVMSRFRLASANKVFKLLNGLSRTKATGLDKISSKVLKAAASTIAPSLTYILTCCFPFDWKMARLLPVYKKGPRTLPENYRPISILPAVSKLM